MKIKTLKKKMSRIGVFVFGIALALFVTPAFAGSATWNLNPSSNWNVPGNWTPATVPNGSADTATFGVSNTTSVTISANTEVNGIVFSAGASPFQISADNLTLTISGAGITNNSGIAQQLATSLGPTGGIIQFTNSATAADASITSYGSAVPGFSGGFTRFFNSATAASATIVNYGGSGGGEGGTTEFNDNAMAGTASITNYGLKGATVFNNSSSADHATIVNANFGGSAISGHTDFFDMSTAGHANITNNGGAPGGRGGSLLFADSAHAGSATIANDGGTSGGEGGTTNFTSNAKGGSASITNSASDGSMGSTGGNTDFSSFADAQMIIIGNAGATMSGGQGGSTAFEQNATAGDGSIITNNGASVSGSSAPGRTFFEAGPATAGNTSIFNLGGNASGALGGQIFFQDSSNAGTAHIDNSGSSVSMAGGGQTTFQDASNASHAFIVSDAGVSAGAGGGRVDFFNASMAGQATFITNGGGLLSAIPGVTDFHDMSSGDHGYFSSNGGSGPGGAGGQTEFFNSSHADHATLIANAGSVGAFGAFTAFWSTSAADDATLIANGGPGQGGGIYFFDSSTGDRARVEVFDNGFLDISDRAMASTSVGIGSLEGSGNVFLGGNNLTVGFNNLSTTFSGVIQDGGENGGTGGSLVVVGTGTLTLSGNNTFTGGMNIFGNVQLDGSVVSNVNVKDGGSLSGTGTVLANLENNGFVGPGDSPGTLTVQNNYTNQSGGTFRAEIGGLAEGVTADLLRVHGDAFLNGGTLEVIRINNFMPLPGSRVTIIRTDTAFCSVFGQFSMLDPIDWDGLIQPMADYGDQDKVDIVFELTDTFLSQALTPNQKSTAENIDNLVGDPRADALIAFLGSDSLGNLPHDYDLIAPEELASIYEIGFSQAVVANMNLQHRMDDIRAGSTGFCANGYQPRETGYSKSTDGKTTIDNNPVPAFIPAPENRWGVFVTGSGDFVNVGDHDTNAHGYDITTGNIIVGADYRVCDHFAVGIDGSYAGSTADLVDRGRVDVDGGKGGAYATLYGYKILGSVIHIDGAVSGGWNSYDTRRTGLQDELARGGTNGSEFNAMLAYGGDWHFGCLLIGTWSSLQYTSVNIDSFTEEGSIAPLHFPDQDEDSFRTTSGIRLACDLKCHGAIIRPEVRGAWQHEYGDRTYPIDAQLASGAGNIFTVWGPSIGRDSALVDAGVTVQWSGRFSTYVYYDGVLGRSNYDNHAVSGGLRLSF